MSEKTDPLDDLIPLEEGEDLHEDEVVPPPTETDEDDN